jgi:hypothetical protein
MVTKGTLRVFLVAAQATGLLGCSSEIAGSADVPQFVPGGGVTASNARALDIADVEWIGCPGVRGCSGREHLWLF